MLGGTVSRSGQWYSSPTPPARCRPVRPHTPGEGLGQASPRGQGRAGARSDGASWGEGPARLQWGQQASSVASLRPPRRGAQAPPRGVCSRSSSARLCRRVRAPAELRPGGWELRPMSVAWAVNFKRPQRSGNAELKYRCQQLQGSVPYECGRVACLGDTCPSNQQPQHVLPYVRSYSLKNNKKVCFSLTFPTTITKGFLIFTSLEIVDLPLHSDTIVYNLISNISADF